MSLAVGLVVDGESKGSTAIKIDVIDIDAGVDDVDIHVLAQGPSLIESTLELISEVDSSDTGVIQSIGILDWLFLAQPLQSPRRVLLDSRDSDLHIRLEGLESSRRHEARPAGEHGAREALERRVVVDAVDLDVSHIGDHLLERTGVIIVDDDGPCLWGFLLDNLVRALSAGNAAGGCSFSGSGCGDTSGRVRVRRGEHS